MEKEEIKESFLRLHKYVQNSRYKGYEFDDLLDSSVVRLFTLNNLLLQRIAIQVGELSPLNPRPILGVKKLESTKARGFFARGYLYYYLLTKDSRWLDLAKDSLDWLLKNYSKGFTGISWGNDFDFACGMGFFPRHLPTIVWTSLISAAFEMAYLITGRDIYLDVVKKSADFIVNEVERHQDNRGICFAYAPNKLRLIHNANLLGACNLLRCWKYFKREIYYDLSKKAYQWSISHMNPDGSLYYGTGGAYRLRNWIDNFHTAYNIDCLAAGYEIGGEDIVSLSMIKKAYEFWVDNFFLEDGKPKYYYTKSYSYTNTYYNPKTYPIDIQCASQAVESMSKLSARHFPDALKTAKKVLSWTIGNMQKPNGAFRYQIRRLWKNNLEPIHWGQSTMLAALGAYLFYSSNSHSDCGIPYI